MSNPFPVSPQARMIDIELVSRPVGQPHNICSYKGRYSDSLPGSTPSHSVKNSDLFVEPPDEYSIVKLTAAGTVPDLHRIPF
jgi:hypothetical protein